ncbi:NAD(P)H-binding protein [Streptosporangium sp. NBC_01639]|uniref:NAD(P)H-binding protein n=1 Tax=Streptosporangium sp. NBC_01639 TaxID=2975948 RepID=UPI00386D2E5B|nr:NAD(P)H-binding protein [Streptosporangium sp. NBC_01639]
MIVVSGASGNLGRRIVEHLLQRVDASRVTALSRTPDKAADLGVGTRFADLADPGSLIGAFDGAERLLIMSLGPVPQRLSLQTEAIDAAVKAGVGHVVYTSIVRAGEPGNPVRVAADHRDTERILMESGLPFTVLRFNTWPEMWTLAGIAPCAVAAGVLPSNTGQGRVGYITRDDSAAVAAAVLAEGGSSGQLLEVTGPEAVTDADIAAALTEATGRRVRHQPVSDEEMAPALLAQGVPEPIALGWSATGATKRDGWFDITTHAVQRLTGRSPASITEFFTSHREELLGD